MPDLRTNLDAAPREPFRYNPALDGVRGVAMILILFVHFAAGQSEWALNRFFGISLALDWFFVLSGYLITTLLLEEWSTASGVSMRRFYVRRGLRLLPALYAMLAVVTLAAFLTPWVPATKQAVVGEAGAAALYVYPAVLAVRGEQAFFSHLWSLSVEEWFYFLWPVLLVTFGLRSRSRRRFSLVVWALVALVAVTTVVRLVGEGNPALDLYASLRPDSLAWGALLAMFMRKLPDIRTPLLDRILAVLGPVGVIGAFYFTCVAVFPRPPGLDEAEYHAISFRSWNYQLGIICAVLFILHLANTPTGRIARTLSWRPLTFVGILSYAMYLWHVPIFLTLNSKDLLNGDPLVEGHVTRSAPAMWAIGLTVGLVSLGVALLSRRFIEQPALRQKQRFESLDYAGKR